VRPTKSAAKYAKVWRQDTDESPLRYFTRRQAENLRAAAKGEMLIEWAMRYGEPSIAAKLAALREGGADRILVVALYPQYSASTTASVNDAVFDTLRAMRWQPALRTAPSFHNDPAYLDAIVARTRETLALLDWTPEAVVISFHGIPERFAAEGDPYAGQCEETAQLLRARMGWSANYAPLAFQSRFGREKWLGPAADETIRRLAADGAKHIAVVTPGFVADCLETLEEIAIAGRDTFLAAGGENFAALPCLNDSPAMTRLLQSIIAREAAGWR
jgi:ferrochelatase